MPEHTYLKDLEPLGWIHTQPSETYALSAFDANVQGKLIIEN
jgi:pre-mRNA-processing factor 8